MPSNKPQTMKQPAFDQHITTMAFPMEGHKFGSLRRGHMQWQKAPIGGLNKTDARVHFLYNPATVSADFAMNYLASPSLQFPVPGDQSILHVPLSQTAEFSLLFDRTYELWGSYDAKGHPRRRHGPVNDPSVVGVMADIYQMQQFTGMTISYSANGQVTAGPQKDSFNGHQGILQLIPSFVYFGAGQGSVLGYYGYISEWGYQITHWTQKMIPMRAEISISWTMLPYGLSATGKPVVINGKTQPTNGPLRGGPQPIPGTAGGR